MNLGSRLEGLNKPYGTNIIISESTASALGDDFTYQMIDMVRVKGKLEPVKIYELIGEGKQIDSVMDSIVKFQQAIKLYYNKEFEKAETLLQELNSAKKTTLYEMYLDRITNFKQTPPPEDWDGVYTFTTK